MALMNTNHLPGSLLLAGSLSLAGSISLYSPAARAENLTDLQKGMHSLRDVYVSVQTRYKLDERICQPPDNSPPEFPEKGLDFSAYRDVNKGLKGKWDALLSVDMDKGGVSEEIRGDAEALIELLNSLDGNSGDGVITKQEWMDGQKAVSDDDKKNRLRGLFFFKGVSDYLLVDKNPGIVDPDTYPELIKARTEIKVKTGESDALKRELDETESSLASARVESRNYRTATMVLGGLLTIGLIGTVIASIRRKRPQTPTTPQQPTPPAKLSTPAGPDPAPATDGVAPQGGTNYADVLNNLTAPQTPSASVLEALTDEEKAVSAQPTPPENTP